MNDFIFFFNIGWQHIISVDALDHLLFIAALSAVYLAKDWKQLLILVTAFTVGHSLTLALSVYDVFRIKDKWVEFLIPLSIVFTALFNLLKTNEGKSTLKVSYVLALVFGLIHGMGFANTIRFMLSKSQTVFTPLLSFNLGLEAGQLVVVGAIMLVGYLLVSQLRLKHLYWIWGLSVLALIPGIKMCIERWPF